jgi:predicted amidohydrolase
MGGCLAGSPGIQELNTSPLKIAAVQIETRIGDIAATLEQVAKLATEAFEMGASVVALPEFFTGVAFPSDAAFRTALPPDNKAVDMLKGLAKTHAGYIGGSMLIADGGDIYNRYHFIEPDQSIHLHDKDLPTAWENAFYIGGQDDGVFETSIGKVGAAVCWELIRHRTVNRMQGRVDFVMSGTHWPDLPINWPTSHLRVTDRLRVANARSSEQAPVEFAKRLGVPVVQASHCGEIKGDLYLFPGVNWHVPYHTSFVGRTQIVDANGQVVASRKMSEGPGVISAVIEVGKVMDTSPAKPADTDSFWIQRLTANEKLFWTYQNYICKGLYRRFGRRKGLRAAAASIRGLDP